MNRKQRGPMDMSRVLGKGPHVISCSCNDCVEAEPDESPKLQEYSVGFMFTDDMSQVALIKKGHGPESVVGRWNGIGGHIEPGETPVQCQVREFAEETGVETLEGEWSQFCELAGEDFVVHAFWSRCDLRAHSVESMTDEEVELVDRLQLHYIPLAPNLKWWIPFLVDRTTENVLGVIIAKYAKDDNLDAAASI